MKTNSTIFFLSVVLGLALAWFVVWPKAQDIDSLRSVLAAQEEDLSVLRQTENSIQDNLDFFAEISSQNVELIELAVPVNPDEPDITNLLNNLAEQNGLIVNDITAVSAAGAAGSFGSVTVTLQLDGSYPSLQEFVESAEQTLRIFDITSIGITSQPTVETPPLPSFNVVGDAYYSE